MYSEQQFGIMNEDESRSISSFLLAFQT